MNYKIENRKFLSQISQEFFLSISSLCLNLTPKKVMLNQNYVADTIIKCFIAKFSDFIRSATA